MRATIIAYLFSNNNDIIAQYTTLSFSSAIPLAVNNRKMICFEPIDELRTVMKEDVIANKIEKNVIIYDYRDV
jgi:hypothetical protein